MSFGKVKILPVDSLFSKYIRSRDDWRCQNCGKLCGKDNEYYKLEAAHYIGRRNWAVRFDPENVHSLCFTCHNKFHDNKALHDEFMIKKLGADGLAKLQIRATTKGSKDTKLIKLYINKLMEELNE